MNGLAISVMIVEAWACLMVWLIFSSKRDTMRRRAEESARKLDLCKKWEDEHRRARDSARADRDAAERAASDAIGDYKQLRAEYDRLRHEYYKTRDEILSCEKIAWQDLAAILKGMQGSKKAAAKRG